MVLHCRSDSRNLAARNFHMKASRVQTIEHVIQTIDLMHTISTYVAHASRRLDFECTTFYPHRLDSYNCLPISVFWKEISYLIEH